ncbi:MAG: ferritin-like domain-containing protein [Acidimicrobiales bacterium]|nr:ferritin-like domain-containing protein [Acidimicrobiales bacterium]
MDLNRDEIRRELKAIDADNKAIMPKWYDALRQIVGGGTKMSTDEKAALLGVPSPGRRQLFKVGGVTLMGAAVLAACGDDDDAASGSGDDSTDDAPEPDNSMDLPLARTAASLEKLAVDTYTTAAGSGLVTTAAIGDAAMLFLEHHQAHLDALNGAIRDAGGTEVTEQNDAVFKALVEPAISAAKKEADVVQLALDLELAAAQTYAFAGGQLSVPALRSTIMTIGGIEARHAVVLQMAAQAKSPLDVFPEGRAFFPGDNPLADIEGAVLSA